MSDNYKAQRQKAGHTAFNQLTQFEHYKRIVERKNEEIESLEAYLDSITGKYYELRDELEYWISQHGCKCGRPHCARCENTKDARKLI